MHPLTIGATPMKRIVACLSLALATPFAAQAQTLKWPVKPVRVIEHFPAGGTTGVVARTNPNGYTIAVVASRFSEVQERLRACGGEPAPSTPDVFAQDIARNIATWSKVIRDGNRCIN